MLGTRLDKDVGPAFARMSGQRVEADSVRVVPVVAVGRLAGRVSVASGAAAPKDLKAEATFMAGVRRGCSVRPQGLGSKGKVEITLLTAFWDHGVRCVVFWKPSRGVARI
jgi:hypothetical protein